jgi:endonuclease-3
MMKMMSNKDKILQIIAFFEKNMPAPTTELHYDNLYQLVVSVILSAQCTDKRVNMTTPAFFESFPDVNALANASESDVYLKIKSISYPNNKAKNLVGMAKTLVEKFNGIFPDDVDSLQELPGVGRKTANVIASVYFNKSALAVDTHVFRVAARLGFTKKAKTVRQCEDILIKLIPPEKVPDFHHWLILHGRYVCVARKPKCENCGISNLCDFKKQSL